MPIECTQIQPDVVPHAEIELRCADRWWDPAAVVCDGSTRGKIPAQTLHGPSHLEPISISYDLLIRHTRWPTHVEALPLARRRDEQGGARLLPHAACHSNSGLAPWPIYSCTAHTVVTSRPVRRETNFLKGLQKKT